MIRVLKPAGSLFVVLGDRYSTGNKGESNLAEFSKAHAFGGGHSHARAAVASKKTPGMAKKSLLGLPWRYALRCTDELKLVLRAEIIWSKPNATPESVTNRVRRAHEQIFHFTRSPQYFADVETIRQPSTDHKNRGAVHPDGKLPGSVWEIGTARLRAPEHLQVKHYAAYPIELARRAVLGWSPAGGVVLDPFGGTGTTALVATANGRLGISSDLSHDYSRLADWRINDDAQVQKADALEAAQ